MKNATMPMPAAAARTATEMSVAKYLVSRIADTGVKIVPVLQGGAIMKLIDEVGENSNLTYVSPNHEQALAMMVDAYARVSGFGVGIVTSGPGGQNLATGIACAYYDSTPCMFITGQVGMFHAKGTRRVRQRGFQETDIVSLVKPITKYAVLVEKAEDARYEFEKAVYLAKSGRPGPVLLDIPYNVQRAMVTPANLKGYAPEDTGGAVPAEIEKHVADILDDIERAERPLILLGGGVELAGQAETVRKLVAALGVPVVVTWCALDIFEADNPLYGGTIGKSGNSSANKAVRESDFVLALGTRFATKAIINEKNFTPRAKLVAVDIDTGELEDGLLSPQVKLEYDLTLFVPSLLRAAKERATAPKQSWITELKAKYFRPERGPEKAPYVNPYAFFEALSDALPGTAVIVADTGTNLCWFAQAYRAKIGQRAISAWGNSPMGYALPASVGAHLAKPNATTVAINGDGGVQMNIQELQTIALNKFPIKIFVLNNNCYANVKFPSQDEFNGRMHALGEGFGYAAPDFLKIAAAYGIPAFSLRGEDDMPKKIREALAASGPVLVDVQFDPDQRAFEDTEFVSPPPK